MYFGPYANFSHTVLNCIIIFLRSVCHCYFTIYYKKWHIFRFKIYVPLWEFENDIQKIYNFFKLNINQPLPFINWDIFCLFMFFVFFCTYLGLVYFLHTVCIRFYVLWAMSWLKMWNVIFTRLVKFILLFCVVQKDLFDLFSVYLFCLKPVNVVFQNF